MFIMKKYFIINATVFTIISCASIGNTASSYTSKDFFDWRAKLHKENPNDFKSNKFCKSLIGSSVVFDSKIINVNKNGTIVADMDIEDILSVPEITLDLSDPDDSEDLKQNQTIKYTGTISDCQYKKTTGVLFLTIKNGGLQLHY